MNKHEEFKQIFYKNNVSEFNTTEANATAQKNITSWLLNNTPTSLFRYRTCSHRNLTQLEADEIWGSRIDKFNDPYECLPYFDVDGLRQWFQSEISIDSLIQKINDIQQGKTPNHLEIVHSKEILCSCFSTIKATKIDATLIASLENARQNLWNYIIDNINNLNYLKNFYFDKCAPYYFFNVASFSELNNSIEMWAHYTDSHKGFVIEYDFKENLKECDIVKCNNRDLQPCLHINTPLAPVIYQEERYKQYDLIKMIIQEDLAKVFNIPISIFSEDVYSYVKCLLTKSSKWKYENEWRLFNHLKADTITKEYKCLLKKEAKAIYIGAKTSPWYEKRLLNFAKFRKIPCYKMQLNYLSPKFEVCPIPKYIPEQRRK